MSRACCTGPDRDARIKIIVGSTAGGAAAILLASMAVLYVWWKRRSATARQTQATRRPAMPNLRAFMLIETGMLIAARGLMGIGGAFIFPTTLSILTNTFRDPRERARAIGVDLLAEDVTDPQLKFVVPDGEPTALERHGEWAYDLVLVLSCMGDEDIPRSLRLFGVVATAGTQVISRLANGRQ